MATVEAAVPPLDFSAAVSYVASPSATASYLGPGMHSPALSYRRRPATSRSAAGRPSTTGGAMSARCWTPLDAPAPGPPPQEQKGVAAAPRRAKVVRTPEARWWRTDSPDAEGRPDGVPWSDRSGRSVPEAPSPTRGVLGFGRRSGPSTYRSQYQTGSGTAANFQDTCPRKTISGYSGFVAGKYAGNVVGGTFNKTNDHAQLHLSTTQQAERFGGLALNSFQSRLKQAGELTARPSTVR
eukprot:TRINITY_DN12191_c0_g1_i1.p1 TRINITY_DN12191_c0_g1~~TRINITY_DN12191_c0_g1_i1.p1  ORF type:complete len:271 (+),score=36.43 TRINITY_DN12191_c0_g1_i1:99-815(+)